MKLEHDEIIVYDDLIDDKLHKAVYDWGQSVSWYTMWLAATSIKGMEQAVPMNEYIPSKHGNYNNRHILGPVNDLSALHKLTKFVMYRHPVGWDDESCELRSPVIWDLWSKINKHFFDGNATLDGIKEPCGGLRGPEPFYDGEDFYKKHDVPFNNNEWSSMLNARTVEIFDTEIGNRVGQYHKDTAPEHKDSDKHFTVLYVANREWYPDWGGELTYFNGGDTGAKHWRRGYDLGWPCKVVGHKPNRIMIYRHDQIHNTAPPKPNAPEMTQKIAFRVRMVS